MISKVIKGLQLNESDTLMSAAGKGMIEGVVDSAIVGVGIGLALIVLGSGKEESSEERTAE